MHIILGLRLAPSPFKIDIFILQGVLLVSN